MLSSLKHDPGSELAQNDLSIDGRLPTMMSRRQAVPASENGPAWLVWLVGLFDGRAAATFVILAGVGISMLSRKGRIAQDQERVLRERSFLTLDIEYNSPLLHFN